MASEQNNENNVILRNIHCPYCENDNALLISEKTKSIISFGLPAYGLKFILSLLYLSFLHIWRYGYKIIDVAKERIYTTYGFCPSCGNSYSAGAPKEVKAEVNDPKFYRVRKGKSITGYCKGISEYTDIPVLWVRIMTVMFGLTLIGAFFYFLIAVCIPFKVDIESGAIENKKFYKAKKGQGKVFMGLCKGIANYTEIPVAWIRILAVLLGFTIIGIIIYIIVGAIAKVEGEENAG